MKIQSILLSSMIFLTACTATSSHTSTAQVDVYKSDGSQQCSGGGVSPEQMQQAELKGMTVLSARKDDLRGVAFPAVCGGDTGKVNVHTIATSDLAKAQQRGFIIFQTESSH